MQGSGCDGGKHSQSGLWVFENHSAPYAHGLVAGEK